MLRNVSKNAGHIFPQKTHFISSYFEQIIYTQNVYLSAHDHFMLFSPCLANRSSSRRFSACCYCLRATVVVNNAQLPIHPLKFLSNFFYSSPSSRPQSFQQTLPNKWFFLAPPSRRHRVLLNHRIHVKNFRINQTKFLDLNNIQHA